MVKADLESGGSKSLTCSRLSLAFALVAAALLILIQLSLNFATYVSADLGPAWAIIQAKSAGTSAGSTGPPEVFFGMFRVCYKNPLVSCTPFSFGMKLEPDAFAGAAVFESIVPPRIITIVYPLTGLVAFAFTFAAAFTFCPCAPRAFTVIVAIAAVVSNLAFLGLAAGLYMWMRGRISTETAYKPSHVMLTVLFDAITLLLEVVVCLLAVLTVQSSRKSRRGEGKRTIEITARDNSQAEKAVLSKLNKLEELLQRVQNGAENWMSSDHHADEVRKALIDNSAPTEGERSQKSLIAFRKKLFWADEITAIKRRRDLLEKSHSTARNKDIDEAVLAKSLEEMKLGKKAAPSLKRMAKKIIDAKRNKSADQPKNVNNTNQSLKETMTDAQAADTTTASLLSTTSQTSTSNVTMKDAGASKEQALKTGPAAAAASNSRPLAATNKPTKTRFQGIVGAVMGANRMQKGSNAAKAGKIGNSKQNASTSTRHAQMRRKPVRNQTTPVVGGSGRKQAAAQPAWQKVLKPRRANSDPEHPAAGPSQDTSQASRPLAQKQVSGTPALPGNVATDVAGSPDSAMAASRGDVPQRKATAPQIAATIDSPQPTTQISGDNWGGSLAAGAMQHLAKFTDGKKGKAKGHDDASGIAMDWKT